jgi:hypothetical protein
VLLLGGLKVVAASACSWADGSAAAVLTLCVAFSCFDRPLLIPACASCFPVCFATQIPSLSTWRIVVTHNLKVEHSTTLPQQVQAQPVAMHAQGDQCPKSA